MHIIKSSIVSNKTAKKIIKKSANKMIKINKKKFYFFLKKNKIPSNEKKQKMKK